MPNFEAMKGYFYPDLAHPKPLIFLVGSIGIGEGNWGFYIRIIGQW